jgi:hypothetical protein
MKQSRDRKGVHLEMDSLARGPAAHNPLRHHLLRHPRLRRPLEFASP